MTQEFVTLPREVVERALASLESEFGKHSKSASDIRAALDQPQIQSGVIPPNWKLVPVEPTQEMFAAACRDGADLNGRPVWKHTVDVQAAWRWGQMLAAAPQPPAVKQPQANQPAMTPIAQRKLDSLLAEGYTISGYSVYHERKHQHGFVTGAGLVGWWKPEGVEYPQPKGGQEPVAWMVTSEMQDGTRSTYPMIGRFKDVQDCCDFGEPVPLIYQHPQPKRKPLTDEQIAAATGAKPGTPMWLVAVAFTRAIEAAHNIK